MADRSPLSAEKLSFLELPLDYRVCPEAVTHDDVKKCLSWGGERTFVRPLSNGQVAPIPAIRWTAIESKDLDHTLFGLNIMTAP